MKKILVIENDSSDFEKTVKVVTLFEDVSYFPKEEDDFNFMRSMISRGMKRENLATVRSTAVEQIRKTIDGYLLTEPIENILCICDYELFSGSPEVNGIEFFKQFMNQNVQVLFISATKDSGDIRKIEQFAESLPNALFISKNDRNFEAKLEQEVTYFLSA